MLSIALLFALASTSNTPHRLPPGAWVSKPTTADISRCMPASTDIGPGEVLLVCQVSADGHMADCQSQRTTDPRLEEWALCVVPRFQAAKRYRGEKIELPLRWTSPR
jgi:hypothetical protein